MGLESSKYTEVTPTSFPDPLVFPNLAEHVDFLTQQGFVFGPSKNHSIEVEVSDTDSSGDDSDSSEDDSESQAAENTVNMIMPSGWSIFSTDQKHVYDSEAIYDSEDTYILNPEKKPVLLISIKDVEEKKDAKEIKEVHAARVESIDTQKHKTTYPFPEFYVSKKGFFVIDKKHPHLTILKQIERFLKYPQRLIDVSHFERLFPKEAQALTYVIREAEIRNYEVLQEELTKYIASTNILDFVEFRQIKKFHEFILTPLSEKPAYVEKQLRQLFNEVRVNPDVYGKSEFFYRPFYWQSDVEILDPMVQYEECFRPRNPFDFYEKNPFETQK